MIRRYASYSYRIPSGGSCTYADRNVNVNRTQRDRDFSIFSSLCRPFYAIMCGIEYPLIDRRNSVILDRCFLASFVSRHENSNIRVCLPFIRSAS